MTDLNLRTIPRLDQSMLVWLNDNFEAIRQAFSFLSEMQWGSVVINMPLVQAAAAYVTFPRPFRNVPVVTATCYSVGGDLAVEIDQGAGGATPMTNTQCHLRVFQTAGIAFNGNVTVFWMAMDT